MDDHLHTVLRSIRGETKNTRDHLSVFREFLGHLDKVARRAPRPLDKSAQKKKPRKR
jgi:hypothetical protein